MKIENLIQQFEKFDTKQFDEFSLLISSKDNRDLFPPYIPHVGESYSKHKILMYGKAQNIDKPWLELIHMSNTEKVRQMYDAKTHNDIWIAPYKIMLSVAGIYLYAKYNILLSELENIHNHIAATNYYKFSFNDSGKDINPDGDLSECLSSKNYRTYITESDSLAISELNLLNPSLVISFNGQHTKKIEDSGYNLITINDPSWILQGGGGCLKETGSWYREIKDPKVLQLVDSYISQLDSQYKGKKEAVKIYLLKYFDEWQNEKSIDAFLENYAYSDCDIDKEISQLCKLKNYIEQLIKISKRDQKDRDLYNPKI